MELPAVHERLSRIPWAACSALDLSPPIAETLDGHPAERVLDRFLRANPGLTADARQAAAEAVFGVSLWRRRAVARLGADLSTAEPGALLFAFLVDLARVAQADAQALGHLSSAPHLSDRPLAFADAFPSPTGWPTRSTARFPTNPRTRRSPVRCAFPPPSSCA